MKNTVRELMHKGLIICPPNASLGEVAASLARHHVHALIVAEQEDKPLGIITDFDLLAGEWLSVDKESLEAMRKMTARELMTSPIESTEADTPVEAAAVKFLEKQIHRMLVVEHGKPVGVISISDFVRDIAAQEKISREKVGDVMSDTFLVCRDKTPVVSAARTMTQAGWRSVIVVDAKGKPLGVVTGNDLMRLAGKPVGESLTVSDVMNRNLVTIDINASLQDAANLMIQNHRHRVIVVDANDPQSFPLGIVSSFDIVAEMARPGSVWQS
ncbi:MAG: CBS domain-containing protein [Anaerolineales bacterium]|nr:CBS domain-containing protein [Anaerolineales bacterium]